MERLQQIKANHRLNIQAGYVWMRAIDRNWLIDTVEKLEEENKNLHRIICNLRKKTSFRVYEENFQLVQEIERLKGERHELR